MKSFLLIFLLLTLTNLRAQPELDIKPNRIEFEDLFNRYDYAFLINKGNQVLSIDSIDYNDSLYILSFENNLQLPFTINPDDTVRMDVTLSGFYYVTTTDTMDTMFVYNNGINSPGPLEVRIRFFEDEFGQFNGTIKDSLNPIDSATVYFFYNGIYLLDTAKSNSSGHYQKSLPVGVYTVGVGKTDYYCMFFDSTYDPFFAKLDTLDVGEVKTLDYNLKHIDNSNYSVSGEIIDSAGGNFINRGIIIVRSGTHVPSPINKDNSALYDSIDVFAGFIRLDGTYRVFTQSPNYYYLQAYSNNFLPGYYNVEGNASVFWQNADSVLIDNNIIDKNISLRRDSSFGNGSIGGSITFSVNADQEEYEGITILARNINNDALYSYNFGKPEGNFRVTNIPYGTYELVAQKIGIDNAISQKVTIDPINNQINGVNLNFNISSAEIEKIAPSNFVLYQNYPNPFNPSTTISFYLPRTSNIKVNVINIMGQIVTTLADGEMSPGNHSILFDGKNLASGVYLIILKSNQLQLSKKMILLK